MNRNEQMILAGDIGGTKTHLGIFKQENGKVISIIDKKYESQQYDSFENLLSEFLDYVNQAPLTAEEKAIAVACFGIAGPIKRYPDGKRYCEMTNIDQWPVITETNLSQLINGMPVFLLNDMEAIGHGISQLDETDLVVLNKGKPQEGNSVIIAAGTGLGIVKLFWKEGEYHPSSSEGGHGNFAPSYDKDNLQIKLLTYLQEKIQGNVGPEQILSGNGLVSIYEFLHKKIGDEQESLELRERMNQEDAAKVISEAALANKDPLCEKALDLFVSIYGSVAGDFALEDNTVGGIYIGGGIAPKILDKMRDPTFMRFFTAKDAENPKFSQFNSEVPVHVIMNSKIGLLGAAWYAAKS